MKQQHPVNNQRGSVLIVALVMLMVLTILGVSSMSSSSLEQRMAGNSRDREIAFQAAEAALAYAEDYVTTNINAASAFTDSNGFYTAYNGPSSKTAFNASTWLEGNSVAYPTALPYANTQPRFTIEIRGEVGEESGTDINIGGYGETTGGGKITAFRVTARGTGLSDNTQVVVQSYYGKRL